MEIYRRMITTAAIALAIVAAAVPLGWLGWRLMANGFIGMPWCDFEGMERNGDGIGV